MTDLLHRLLRNIVRNPELPENAPVSACLEIDGTRVPVDLRGAGAGTLLLDASLVWVPQRTVVLGVRLGQAARIDFPVRLVREGRCFRALLMGAPLVLRRRVTRNGQLEDALGIAA
jgi:hypothetical protein